MTSSFVHQCTIDTLDGLREGLSHFSGASRAAVIHALKREAPMRVYDPLGLLTGHEPRFRELFVESDEWRKNSRVPRGKKQFIPLIELKNLELA
ncbi:MAG: DNA-binding protein, partial [Desulfobacterales bacterium]|nr:DNA-binding protein [Desulfobacterales bacterium]